MAAVGAGSGDSSLWRPLENFAADAALITGGETMILANGSHGPSGGHWRRYGGAITVGELFYEFGERYTAQELFFWYYHAEKLVKKRAHSKGSQEVREAAQLRFKTFGHYGHRNEYFYQHLSAVGDALAGTRTRHMSVIVDALGDTWL